MGSVGFFSTGSGAGFATFFGCGCFFARLRAAGAISGAASVPAGVAFSRARFRSAAFWSRAAARDDASALTFRKLCS